MQQSVTSCHIFTTLRFDEELRDNDTNTAAAEGESSSVFLLKHHYERLIYAATALIPAGPVILERAGLTDVGSLRGQVERMIQEQSKSNTHECFRLRLQIDEHASLTSTISPVHRLPTSVLFPQRFCIPANTTWTVCIDKHATSASISTSCKTNDRLVYDRARSNAGILSFTMEQEVLLYDEDGRIFDASITTPYFFRHQQWVTPAAEHGGQRGTTRKWALSQGLCVESTVLVKSVTVGEVVWLSNAARGFFPAIVA